MSPDWSSGRDKGISSPGFSVVSISYRFVTHAILGRALAFGAIAANAMLYPRVLVAVAVLNWPLLPLVARYLAPPAVAAMIAVIIGVRRSSNPEAPVSTLANPLQLAAALQMAILFQAMIMLVHAAGGVWGSAGVYGSAFVLGLSDVDALTVAMSRGVAYAASLDTAAVAIAVGVLSNTMLKLAVALLLGSSRFRRLVGPALGVMALTALAALILI